MPPCLINVRSAPVDVNIPYVNIRPCVINPTGAVPAMIDHMMVTPVEVHGQPTPDYQTEAKGNERRSARVPSLDIDNRRIIPRDIYVLRLGRNDLDIISIRNYILLAGTLQIAGVSRLPPETLDRTCYVFRLADKSLSQVGSPVHIISQHFQSIRIVGNCLDGLIPVLPINP
jgi:hypothetical protein